MQPKTSSLSLLLCAALCMTFTPSASAQITQYGPFTGSSSGLNGGGVGTGSSSGGTTAAGVRVVKLQAELDVSESLAGDLWITQISSGLITAGPLGAVLQIKSELTGLMSVVAINGPADQGQIEGQTAFSAFGNVFLHTAIQAAPAAIAVDETHTEVIWLPPGAHALAMQVTAQGKLTDDNDPLTQAATGVYADSSGLEVTFTELSLPTVYCAPGTSEKGCKALIEYAGSASATAKTGMDLRVTGVQGLKDGLFFFGTSGRMATSWGNGTSFMCVFPPVQRTPNITGTGTKNKCDGVSTLDINALWCPTCPKPAINPGMGAVVQAQFWYRDPMNTSNQTTSLSDAIEFIVTK